MDRTHPDTIGWVIPDKLQLFPELLTLAEAAQACDCEEATVVDRLRSGDLPGTKLGRGWTIPRQAFFQRLNELALEEAKERRGGGPAIAPVNMPAVKRPRGRPRKHELRE